MFDCISAIGVGFPLNFLLGFVIILLHVHKNGTHARESGNNKGGRKKYAGGGADNRRPQQSEFRFAGRLDLIRKTEFIHAISGRINTLQQGFKQGFNDFRILIGNPHMVFIFPRVTDDGIFGPQIVTQRFF